MHNYFRYILILTFIFLTSCGDTWSSIKRGLTGEKKISTDEFLVKKKDPLVQPPNFKKMPKPGVNLKEDQQDTKNIEELFSTEKIIDNTSNEISGSGTTEENILRKIKGN